MGVPSWPNWIRQLPSKEKICRFESCRGRVRPEARTRRAVSIERWLLSALRWATSALLGSNPSRPCARWSVVQPGRTRPLHGRRRRFKSGRSNRTFNTGSSRFRCVHHSERYIRMGEIPHIGFATIRTGYGSMEPLTVEGRGSVTPRKPKLIGLRMSSRGVMASRGHTGPMTSLPEIAVRIRATPAGDARRPPSAPDEARTKYPTVPVVQSGRIPPLQGGGPGFKSLRVHWYGGNRSIVSGSYGVPRSRRSSSQSTARVWLVW